jgi:excisionase family DNA binding protein
MPRKPATAPEVKLLTVPEVAEILRVSDRTVWSLISDEELKACRVRRRVFVPQAGIDDFIRRNPW